MAGDAYLFRAGHVLIYEDATEALELNPADALGVDVRHVRRLVHERRIPYIKWGHLLRFDPADIAAWVDACRRHPSRPHNGA